MSTFGVIGATGMLGHHAARAIQAAGHALVVLHRRGARLDRLADLTFTAREADLDAATTLPPALAGLDGIINAAAYYPTVPQPWRDEVGTAFAQMDAFYDACAAARVPRIVYVGGAIALRRPDDGTPGNESIEHAQAPADTTPYVQVKYVLDRLARDRAAQGLPIVIGIPTMSFGEYDYGPTTGRFVVELANGTMAKYVPGKRNTVYAGDAGRGLLLALEKGRPGERYLITGENVTMEDLVTRIARITGRPVPKPVPLGVARVVGKMQEWRWRLRGGEPPKLSGTAIAIMASGQFVDGAKAQRELGYAPEVTLDEALARALAFFRAEGYVRPA